MNPGDTCTPIYGLPYPTGASKPCNIGDTLCDFANAVEAQLDVFDATVNRTFTTIPMVKIRRTIAQTHTTTVFEDWIFDTTLVDTDNMFNGDTDPTIITFNTSGVYLFFFNVYASSTGTQVVVFTPALRLGTTTVTSHNLTTQTGLGMYPSGSQIYPVTAGQTATMRNQITILPPDTVTILRVEMGAIWLGDLP